MLRERVFWVAAIAVVASLGIGAGSAQPTPEPPLGDATTEEKLARLEAMIESERQANVPAGTVVAFAGTVVPAGWRLCNGDEVAVNEHRELYGEIGTTYGVPSKEGLFKLPDLRGMFLRGAGGDRAAALGQRQEWTTGQPRHKDFAIRILEAGGHTHAVNANGGRAVRFIQVEGRAPGNGANTPAGIDGKGEEISCAWNTCSNITVESGGAHSHEARVSGFDSETRPDNCSVQFMIKLGRVTGPSFSESKR